MSNQTFRATVEALLEGKILCTVSSSTLYQYLCNESSLDDVNQYLVRLGRGVARTSDHAGFYCVYLDIESRGVRRETITHFERLATDWEALLIWLRLTRQVSTNAHPISAGDVIRESELLASIESSPDQQKDLEDIISRFRIKGRASGPREQLSRIIDYLKTEGFLIEMSEMTYMGTARWSMLQEQMEFIREQDGIEEAKASEEEQEALF